MLKRLRQLGDAGVDFAFESTLSSRTFAPFLQSLKKRGYRVVIYYFSLANAQLAVRRVKLRQLSGYVISAPATEMPELVGALMANDVPCGPVLNVADLVDHPQVRHRELLDHSGRGKMHVPVRPVKYSRFRDGVQRPPPRLGEHTREVLVEAGVTGVALESLVAQGS